MNNLMVGSEGFIGKSLCKYLQNMRENVTRFDYKIGNDARYDHLPLKGIDRIYFLAWDVGGAKYLYEEESQLDQIKWNTKILINMMQQIERSSVPFLFVSSQLSFCNHAYGVTKKLGELWTRLLNGCCIRLWNIYGSYEEQSQRSHIIGDLIHQALKSGTIRLLTTGEEKRQFIHIDDFNDVAHYIINHDIKDICDISSYQWVSIREVAELIAQKTNSNLILGDKIGKNDNIEPMNIPNFWEPNISLEQGIDRTIELYDKTISHSNL